MVFSLKSVNHEKVQIPIGRLFVWRAFKPIKKKTICQAESVFATTLLSLNNCRVRAKMKPQGIPVLSIQVCFTKYLFCLYGNQCFMFHLLSITTDKQNYLNLTYIGTFTRRLLQF